MFKFGSPWVVYRAGISVTWQATKRELWVDSWFCVCQVSIAQRLSQTCLVGWASSFYKAQMVSDVKIAAIPTATMRDKLSFHFLVLPGKALYPVRILQNWLWRPDQLKSYIPTIIYQCLRLRQYFLSKTRRESQFGSHRQSPWNAAPKGGRSSTGTRVWQEVTFTTRTHSLEGQ